MTQDFLTLTGMVIKSAPIGEYDRRITILTKEKGKIGAFAKGSRRPGSRLMAAATPFSFGTFKVYEGRSSYNIVEVKIENYFEELRIDYEAAFYGMYFLEIADYYTRENNDDVQMLRLLYQSLRALNSSSLDNELVQYIFEMKTLVVNGEFPGIISPEKISSDTAYAIEYVASSTIEKLYTFTLSKEIFEEFKEEAALYRQKYIGRNFKSLKILENCRLKN